MCKSVGLSANGRTKLLRQRLHGWVLANAQQDNAADPSEDKEEEHEQEKRSGRDSDTPITAIGKSKEAPSKVNNVERTPKNVSAFLCF